MFTILVEKLTQATACCFLPPYFNLANQIVPCIYNQDSLDCSMWCCCPFWINCPISGIYHPRPWQAEGTPSPSGCIDINATVDGYIDIDTTLLVVTSDRSPACSWWVHWDWAYKLLAKGWEYFVELIPSFLLLSFHMLELGVEYLGIGPA